MMTQDRKKLDVLETFRRFCQAMSDYDRFAGALMLKAINEGKSTWELDAWLIPKFEEVFNCYCTNNAGKRSGGCDDPAESSFSAFSDLEIMLTDDGRRATLTALTPGAYAWKVRYYFAHQDAEWKIDRKTEWEFENSNEKTVDV